MKNSKFLKLISLALTVALLVTVAVPTLTTSAEDPATPEYVTDITFDFEDGERHTDYGTVIDTPAEGIPAGDGKWLNIGKTSNHNTFFNDTYMKAGESYLVVFDYFVYDSNDADIWFKPVYDSGNVQFAMQVYMSNTSTMTEWKTYSRIFTAARDSRFGIVTNDGLYIDNFRIYNMKNGNYAKSAYVADDGDDNLLNEVNVYPESASVNVNHVYDESVSANVTTFNLTKTADGYGAFVPFHFEAGKTYKIKFKYFADGVNGTEDKGSRCWFRILGASPGTGEISLATPNTPNPTWISFDKEYTPTQSFNGLYFDASRKDIANGGHIAMKVYNFSIIELSTENTATKQTYTIDTHDFAIYTAQCANMTTTPVEKDNFKTGAIKANCANGAVAQINVKLDSDCALTADKWYKLSYDIKGKGNIAATMTSGGWEESQYKTEMVGTSAQGFVIDTENWKHHETVFKASYASTHMYIRVSSGTQVYFDNITIEEYTPFEQITVNFDDGYVSAYGYSVVDDPVAANAGNKVLKNNNGSYQYFLINAARFVSGHTYEVTFKYCGTNNAWFRTDIANSLNTSSAIKSYAGHNAADTWKTARYLITATDAMDMATFAVMCTTANGANYFDDFTITDISNFDANDETLDYGSDNGAFIPQASYATVTKEVDETKGTVTKITFTSSSTYDNSRMSIPFALQKDKTYVIKITYKSNTFVAISWDDKALGDAGLGASSKWTTATRYAKGTTGDMPYFAVPKTNTGTELYIADITITEATAEGGLNGDGVIDTTDYTLMRNRFFSAKRDDSKQFEKYADQNSDGTVDVLDMVLLSKIGK